MPGVSPQQLVQRLTFHFLVRDNDGEGLEREGEQFGIVYLLADDFAQRE
jgi:hypothetical protein